jgi:hypothetical protein
VKHAAENDWRYKPKNNKESDSRHKPRERISKDAIQNGFHIADSRRESTNFGIENAWKKPYAGTEVSTVR